MKRRNRGTVAAVACLAVLVLAPSARAGESLDPSFGEGGISFPGVGGASINALAQDAEGRLVGAGGAFDSFIVGRYLLDGSLDESFGRERGTVRSSLGRQPIANALAVQPDGKIIAAGSGLPGTVILARYLPDGRFDPSFGKDGQARFNLGRRGGGALDVAVLPSGRILTAGYGIGRDYAWQGAVTAFKPSGTIDSRYSGDGVSTFTVEDGGDTPIEVVAMQPLADGKLLLAGDIGGRVMVVRLRANGDLDPDFSGNGFAYADIGHCLCSYATAIALDRRGRAVVSAGLARRGRQPAALLRFEPDGGLDRSFGKDGIVRTFLGSRLLSHAVAIQHNGRIVLAGAYNVPGSGEARVAVVRYLRDGEIDRDFGRKGFFIRDFGVEGVAYAALVQRNGRVVIAGRANPKPSPFHENESVFDTAQVFLARFLP